MRISGELESSEQGFGELVVAGRDPPKMTPTSRIKQD